MWARLVLCSAVMFLSAATAAFVPEFFNVDSPRDYSGPGSGAVLVEIPEGATGKEIATILANQDVVASRRAFIKAFDNESRSGAIQPGKYNLKKKMSASQAMSALLDDASRAEITVTIPEGFTKQQVYNRLANLLGTSESEVMTAAENTAAYGLPDEAGGDPEGWFAPSTYRFEGDTTPTEAMKEMVSKRVEQLQDTNLPREQWQETLIKASIVEREVNTDEYYAMVARVIENRLVDTGEVAGKLQMDSTVLYGTGKRGGSPTREELEDTSNQYNTYQHTGLPPGPIGTPGDKAIKAVISPAEGDWLYFVTVNLDTGETKFASTYSEHQQNLEEYKAWRQANPNSGSSSSGDATATDGGDGAATEDSDQSQTDSDTGATAGN